MAACGHNCQDYLLPFLGPGFLSCLTYSITAEGCTSQSLAGFRPRILPSPSSLVSCRLERPESLDAWATVM